MLGRIVAVVVIAVVVVVVAVVVVVVVAVVVDVTVTAATSRGARYHRLMVAVGFARQRTRPLTRRRLGWEQVIDEPRAELLTLDAFRWVRRQRGRNKG